MTRREALKLGTSTAISAALLPSAGRESVAATERNTTHDAAAASAGDASGASAPNLALDIAAWAC
jgi:hypothetical protein